MERPPMKFKSVKLSRAIIAGIVGAIAMSIVGVWIAPMMGMERMNPANMLAMAMGNNMILGWVGHLMVGAILAIIYASLQNHLPGPSAIRGAVFSLAPWILLLLIVSPMMGMPMFMGSMMKTVQSLIGHIVYGLVMGSVYNQSKQVR